jgi:alanine racemase
MTLKSRVSLIRNLPKGHGISYGRTSILEKDTAVATIGIGYGDGLPRALSGHDAHVLIKGKCAPLLGRVTMDQIMADVSHLPDIQPGDEVELFGPNLPVTQIAKWSDTIPWEVLTRITPRVTRQYHKAPERTASL